MTAPGGDPFSVVFVCSGNRFRSPLAEALFRRAAVDVPVEVGSLGTLELGSLPPLDDALHEATRLELDLSGHRSRPLAGQNLEHVDLVLGFERMHVVTAVVDARARQARSFTLPELVELLEGLEPDGDGDPVERARRAVALAAAAREPDPRAAALRAPELADPLGKPRAVAHETADRIADLTNRLARGLFGR